MNPSRSWRRHAALSSSAPDSAVSDTTIGEATVAIVYDGDCPFCRAYVRHLRLQRSTGGAKLVNAREDPALVRNLEASGYRLNDGMLIQVGERLYYGPDAVHVLALMSSPHDWFNRINYRVFRSRSLAGLLYPVLVMCRRLLLRLLGRKPLQPDGG